MKKREKRIFQKKREKTNFPGTVIVCVMALFMIAISAILLFVPKIKAIHICYLLCSAVIILGIYMIVRYFMTSAFRNLNEYGFSEGTFLVVLGICGMVRAESLAKSFFICIGLLLLLSCVIKLQYTLDLKQMGDKGWHVILVIMLILIFCSIAVILDPFNQEDLYEKFACYLLLIDGIASLLLILYVAIQLNFFEKKATRALEEKAVPPNGETQNLEMTGQEKEQIQEPNATNKQETSNTETDGKNKMDEI